MSFFKKKGGASKASAPPNGMGNRPLPEQPSRNNYSRTLDNKARTRGAFGEEPEEGWHHDERAMGIGLGVYFTYPVIYVGRIELPQSISTMPHQAQTDITREAIASCVDESFPRTPSRRNVAIAVQRYRFGYVDPMMFDVKLSMSARGIIIAPLDDPDGIVGFYPMRNISLATGGENADYDYISFTARDKETGVRHSHVFDCGIHSDDVMKDLGQAFKLAQELAAKSGQVDSGMSYMDVVPDNINEALAPPPGAEALYADLQSIQPVANPMYGMNSGGGGSQLYDTAASGGAHYFDVRPDPEAALATDEAYRDVVPKPIGPPQDSYLELDIPSDPLGHQIREMVTNEALYDTAMPGEQLADKLNEHDKYAKKDPLAAQWTAYDTAQVANPVDVEEYRGRSKLRELYGGDLSHYDIAADSAPYDVAGC